MTIVLFSKARRVRPFLAALALSLFSALPCTAQVVMNPVSPMQTGLTTVTATALTVPPSTNYAIVCARGGAANFTTDGTTAPTSTTGMALLQNTCTTMTGNRTIVQFSAIQQGGSTTTLDVSYFRF